MPIEIAPSVLSFDLTTLAGSLQEFEAGGAGIIHLDVMDGQFVPPITFGDSFAASIRRHTSMPMEAHLMTLNPEAQFKPFQDAGCRRIIFHAEATPHAYRLVQQLKEMGLQAGVAINPGTPATVIEPYLHLLDLALVMTVNPGWGGQKFLASVLPKIQTIRSWRADLAIQVDGGIDPQTIGMVKDAGATSFVVGSHLLRVPSVSKGIQELLTTCS